LLFERGGALQERLQRCQNLLHRTAAQSFLLSPTPGHRLVGSTTFGGSSEITTDVIEIA
jgi:hypothetical protein